MQTLPDHLTQIVAFLRAVIGRVLPPGHRPVWEGPSLYVVLTNRCNRAARRIATLHALWLAGRLPKPRPAQTRRPNQALANPDLPTPENLQQAPAPAPAPEKRPYPRTPRGHAWLLRRGGHQAAYVRQQLDLWLTREDLPAFLAAIPRAGRHLRPMCRMLGAPQPPCLALPPRPARKRSPRPPKPRRIGLRDPNARLPPGDPPFRDYVIATARAWRRKTG